MISKPLFKQSFKANIGIWSFVTILTSLILGILILVIGSLHVGTISNSMIDIFVSDSIEASIEKQSMTYFNLTEKALINFDSNTQSLDLLLNTQLSNEQKSNTISAYNTLIQEGKTDAEAREALLGSSTAEEKFAINALLDYYLVIGEDYSHEKINEYVLMQIEEEIYQQLVVSDGETSANYSRLFIHQAVNDFIASPSTNPSQFATFYIPQVLKDIFYEQTIENDGKTIRVANYFTKEEIEEKSLSAIISFKAHVNIKEEQVREQISTENPSLSTDEIETQVASQIEEYKITLISSLSGSLLDELPENIASSLQELGNLDISELVIGSMFFKMAGILLPIVYIIMASNNLVASQIDSGSMAYVLSTPTKRRTVLLTQMAFLTTSLFIMFSCTTIVGMICKAIAGSAITISYGKMALLNLGAFITMFAISGICFLASSWFNRSKQAMSIGGGLSMFFLVATILGLFGSSTIPSMLRVSAMKYFNYFSIISLFDCVSILEGTLTFIWKLAILLAVGIICYIVSIIKFKKKDLPL